MVMPISIFRAAELHNVPAKGGKPARRGLFGVGRSHFYEEIEPHLERVRLGEKAVGYTNRSVEKYVESGIEAAAAERDPAPAQKPSEPPPKRPRGRPRKHLAQEAASP
jgi:hypothetical protein